MGDLLKDVEPVDSILWW